MPNKKQIKLIQTAVNTVGLRASGQYKLVLEQYHNRRGRPVTSCKDLNNAQIDNLLAICESMGWRHPDKPAWYYRNKDAQTNEYASFAQQAAIRKMAGDLGWNDEQLAGMIKRVTRRQVTSLAGITPRMAYNLIEALKAMLGRGSEKVYKNLTEVQNDMEVAKDGQVKQTG